MNITDLITMKINDILTSDRSQYLEGKLDGLNIALRDVCSYPRPYVVTVQGEESDQYATIIVLAKSEQKAIELAKKEAEQFPEFKDKNKTTYDARLIEAENNYEEYVIWMS